MWVLDERNLSTWNSLKTHEGLSNKGRNSGSHQLTDGVFEVKLKASEQQVFHFSMQILEKTGTTSWLVVTCGASEMILKES